MSDGVGERTVSIVKTSLTVGGVLLAGLLLRGVFSPGNADTASARVPDAEVSADPGKVSYDSLPSGSQAASNYVTGASWTKNPVTYSIGNCPRSLDCGLAQQATREALESWDAVCGLRLDEVAAGGDIAITWASGNHGDGQPLDGPGRILGHSFFPISWLGSLAGDIHLDDSETWVVNPPTQQGQAHLKTVVMHEAGHALGLDHSQDSSALMWAEYQGVRGLSPDDIAGAQSLYGPPGLDEGSAAVPTAVSGVTVTATVTVRIRSGPGTSYTVVGRVPTNTLLPVLGRNAPSSWLYIDYLGIKGWVFASLFLLSGDLNTVPVVDQNGNGAGGVPPSQPTSIPVPPGSPTGVTATAEITARVRSGPGTGYLIVSRVMTGETVPVLGRNADNTWIYVDMGGVKGWTSARLFNISGDLALLPVMFLQEAG